MTEIVGTGNQYVYVYYYAQYEAYKDNYYWPCKIGMSKRPVTKRVLEQTKTALPESPKIGLIIKTDDAYPMEQALHWILKTKQRQIKNAPGQEWYNTTPDEVLMLAQLLRFY